MQLRLSICVGDEVVQQLHRGGIEELRSNACFIPLVYVLPVNLLDLIHVFYKLVNRQRLV